MADEKILIEIEVNNDEAVKNLEKQNEEIDELEGNLKELAKTQGKNTLEYQKENAKLKDLKKARTENIKAIKTTNNSYGAMKVRLKEVTKAIDQIDLSTEQGREAVAKLREEQNKLNTSLKEGEARGNSFSRNVGNYTNGIKEAIPAVDSFTTSFKGFSAALISNPILAILTGLEAVFSSLWGILKRTKVVTDLVNDALTAISSVFDSIGKILTGQIGLWEGLTSAIWDNAEAAVEAERQQRVLQRGMTALSVGIAKLSKEEERLQGIVSDGTISFQEKLRALNKLAITQESLSFLKTRTAEQQVKLAEKQLELAKGTDKEEEARVKLAEQKIKLVEAQGEAEVKALERARTERQINQDIWEQELDFIIDVGEKERERYEEQATNESLSFAKRKEALDKYKGAYDQFLNAQQKQFEKIGLSEEELNRLLGIKDPAELAQAITGIKGLSEVEKNRLREVLIEFKNSTTEQLKVQQAYDKIIEDKNKQKREQKKQENQEVINDEQQLKITLASLDDEYTNNALKNNEELKQAKIQADREKEQSEKQYAQAREKLLSSAFTLAKQLAGKNEKLAKSIGLVEVAINTARGIMQAFGNYGPTPVGYATAASVAAIGTAQALAITSASPGSTPTPPPTPQAQPNTSAADQALAQQQALETAIANLGLTVSVTEINDAQNNVQVTQQTASI